MKKSMRAGAWRIYLVVGTLAVVGYFLLPGHQAGRDRIVAGGQNLLESR